nr:MAG TPA: hypothetical protein [Caudoviricetes sp.]
MQTTAYSYYTIFCYIVNLFLVILLTFFWLCSESIHSLL